MGIVRDWRVPRIWPGETVVIIGGGPSLTDAQIREARRFRRIAVNDAFIKDPGADVVCWGDQKWFLGNRHELLKHEGEFKIGWRPVPEPADYTIHLLKHAHSPPNISTDPGVVRACNSGVGAMNLAFLFGAKRILLIGFDMKQGEGGRNNWHDRHKRFNRVRTSPEKYRQVFIPECGGAANFLGRAGVEVINCTPGSALRCFKFGLIEGIEPARKRA